MNRDDELSRKLADTLERSLDAIDADALVHLAHARRDALNRRARVRRFVVGVALAASVVAVAVVPYSYQKYAHQQAQKAEGDLSYLAVDPQMLSDMEMLQVLGESGDGVQASGS